MNRLLAIVNRVMGKHLPPEQPPTGRVCVKCRETIGKHDRYRIRVAEHLDCRYPQGGSPLLPSLERLTNEGAQ